MEPGRALPRLSGVRFASSLSRRHAYGAAAVCLLALGGCATTTQTPTETPTTFAVTGTVRASPACPGPVRLDSTCPDRPIATATVTVTRDGTTIASTVTDSAGHYRFQLPAGRYAIGATNTGGYASQATQTVDVPPAIVVDLTVDSGMR